MDCLGRADLPKIPSEYIEPYMIQYISYELENIASGYRKPSEALANLKAMDLFINRFCSIHAQYAMMNFISMFERLDDQTIIDLAKQSLKDI